MFQVTGSRFEPKQFHPDGDRPGRGMIAAGIRPGDRVGIMSRTCFWSGLSLTLRFGMPALSPCRCMKRTLPPRRRGHLSHSEAVAIFVEDEKLLNRVAEAEDYAALLLSHANSSTAESLRTAILIVLSARASEVSEEQLEQVTFRCRL